MARSRRVEALQPVENRQLVIVANKPDGEDPSIYECDINDHYNADQLARGVLRLFDPKTDDRGPEVPFIATFGNKPSTWHPKTSGTYIVTFKRDTPEAVTKKWSLGMGSCSSPQHSRAQIAKVFADMSKNAELKGHLRVLKVPCIFRADAPSHPGGSCVEIDPATLPAPVASRDHLDMTFG